MKMRKIFLFFLTVLVLSINLACGPRVAVKPSQVITGEEEFSKAEELYEKGDHGQALEKYLGYVEIFPRTSFTPAAFMKIGSLYKEAGQNENARNAYKKLINDFPGSEFALDARVEILTTLLNEQKYTQLLEWSAMISQKNFSRVQKLRIFMMNAESYLATGERIDAAVEFFKAYGLATPLEKQTVGGKIKVALEGLSDMEIQALISRLKNPDDVNMVMAMKEATSFNRDVVVCLLPLSGSYKSVGDRALKGIEMAFSQWMARNFARFRIIVKDTGGDGKKTAFVMEEILKEKPACIIGPVMAAEEASSIAQAHQIPIITLSQKELLPEVGDFVFRNFITPEMQTRALVSYAFHVRGAKNFAILYPKEKFGETYMNAFLHEVSAIGGEITAVESYAPDLTDFAGPVKRLAALRKSVARDNATEPTMGDKAGVGPKSGSSGLDFDALFIPESAKKAAMILPQLTYYDVKNVLLLGTNLWHSGEFIKQAGNNADAVVLSEGFFEESSFPVVRQFSAEFMEAYGEKPQFVEAIAYDTAWLVFQTLSRGSYRNRAEVKDAFLRMPPFEGVTGLTTFGKNGEAEKKIYLLSIEGGKFVQLIH
ncbi:MAG: ABC transporter substrate-binding protein [Proteobacteria bacterium]|nr:ABC transporter substrate-binding protein [Pseudomonadota bacterium]